MQLRWLERISARHGMFFRPRSRPDVQRHSLDEARAYRIDVIKGDVSEREQLALGLSWVGNLTVAPTIPTCCTASCRL